MARLKRMLIGDGSDVDALDEQGGTAALAASLAGQAAFLDVPRTAGADLGRSSAVAPPRGDVAAVDAARLALGPAPADLRVEERAPGVLYMRGCCSAAEVESLARLHASLLPVAKAAKLQCGLERRHFVDAHRWLDALVRRALPTARVRRAGNSSSTSAPTARWRPMSTCRSRPRRLGRDRRRDDAHVGPLLADLRQWRRDGDGPTSEPGPPCSLCSPRERRAAGVPAPPAARGAAGRRGGSAGSWDRGGGAAVCG